MNWQYPFVCSLLAPYDYVFFNIREQPLKRVKTFAARQMGVMHSCFQSRPQYFVLCWHQTESQTSKPSSATPPQLPSVILTFILSLWVHKRLLGGKTNLFVQKFKIFLAERNTLVGY